MTIPVITRYPRPATRVALPQSEDALLPRPRQQPAEQRSWVPARLASVARVLALCAFAIVVLLAAAALVSGCAPPPRPPVPDALAQVTDLEHRISEWTLHHEWEQGYRRPAPSGKGARR